MLLMACSTVFSLEVSRGFVRVINYRTHQHVDLKGFETAPIDLDFAHTADAILGIADGSGCLHIYSFSFEQEHRIEYPFWANILLG